MHMYHQCPTPHLYVRMLLLFIKVTIIQKHKNIQTDTNKIKRKNINKKKFVAGSRTLDMHVCSVYG